jgi:hypothetical protein
LIYNFCFSGKPGCAGGVGYRACLHLIFSLSVKDFVLYLILAAQLNKDLHLLSYLEAG